MKHRNVVTVAIAVFGTALAGTVLGLAATAGASTTHSVATTAAASSPIKATPALATARHPRYVVLNCGKPLVRPASYVLACADDGIGLQSLHWTSWTAALASGYGTFYQNDCTPNCASGHVHFYQALATLWGSATVKGHPCERQYTKLTLIFDGRHRPVVYRSKNGKLVKTHPLTQTFGTF